MSIELAGRGKMSLKEVLKATHAADWKEAVAKLGYGEMFGLGPDSTFDFIVTIDKPEEIRRIVGLVGLYNEFRGVRLADVLAALAENGTLMYVEFGRRGSPELRLFMKNPGQDRERVTEILKQFEPSELEEFGPYGIRAWWD